MAQRQREDARGPFAGYHARRAGEPDPELTLIDRGTPCGEYMRRFWHPIALIGDLDDSPVAIDVLGEELVLFRDLGGRIGLLQRRCSHRNTSLEFAKLCERGLRCCYHGWHYDIDGTILDIPGEAPGSTLKERLFHGAYPVIEHAGLVFAYMGPPDRKPDFPVYDFMAYAGQELYPVRWRSDCNWLQLRENTQDPIHFVFLHSMFEHQQFGPWSYEVPEIEAHQTPIGQITTSARRVYDYLYVRTNELILPTATRVPDVTDFVDEIPLVHRRGVTEWTTPLTNASTIVIGWFHMLDGMDDAARRAYLDMIAFGQDGERPYRERRRNPGDWDAWMLQGEITVHGNEHLTAADCGVALYRRQLREGIAAVADGRDPKGIVRGGERPIRSYASNMTRLAPKPEDVSAADDRQRWIELARDTTAKALAGEVRQEQSYGPEA